VLQHKAREDKTFETPQLPTKHFYTAPFIYNGFSSLPPVMMLAAQHKTIASILLHSTQEVNKSFVLAILTLTTGM